MVSALKHFPQFLHYLSYIDTVQQPQLPLANCFHKHLSVCKHMLLCNTIQLIYLFKEHNIPIKTWILVDQETFKLILPSILVLMSKSNEMERNVA